jgi:hypothetical protein
MVFGCCVCGCVCVGGGGGVRLLMIDQHNGMVLPIIAPSLLSVVCRWK